MRGGIVVLALLGACGPKVLDANIYRLPHPSAGGALPPHTVQSDGGYRMSLTKVTRDEICIDTYITSYSTTADRALADAKKRLTPRSGVGFCRGRDQSETTFCGENEPFPVTQVFEPVIYAVEFSTEAYNTYETTGNRELVCAEDLRNQRGTVVGCARYVEQDEEVSRWNGGVLFYSRGGWRACVPNKGRIGPTTKEFDFAFSLVPFRFVFEGGKSVDGAWGATGGTSAETPAVVDLAAARAAAQAGEPTVTWVAPATDTVTLGRTPKTKRITSPAPRATPSLPPAPSRPATPTSRPTTPTSQPPPASRPTTSRPTTPYPTKRTPPKH